jgi:hypothetical protein
MVHVEKERKMGELSDAYEFIEKNRYGIYCPMIGVGLK